MKQIKKLLYASAFLLTLNSCNEDFLERQPLDMISSEAVYNDPALVEAYLFKAYNYMPNGYGTRNLDGTDEKTPGVNGAGYGNAYILDCLTDLMTNKSSWPASNGQIVTGQIYPTKNDLDIWEHAYTAIRYCNMILDNMKTSKLSTDFIARINAEARFIRAYMYFDLARRYGDVPLIKELQSLDNFDEVLVSRTPVSEVYAFIDQEYTEIAEILPSVANLASSDLGRATREACWALNGRVQLYAKNYARSAEISKKVIDSNLYSLAADYNKLFQSYGGDKEVIFEVLFNGADKGHGMDRLAYPFSHRADWGSQMLPTQELVDAYEMTNGLPITDAASGYNPEKPYENRDSRLSATVLYHGNLFKGTPILVALSSDITILPNDVDAPNLTGNHSTTGYYLKKFLDESIPDGPGWGVSKTSWKEIRLGEVLLNYAEAQNEAAGPDQSVYDAVNKVRARAAQPALPAGLSKDQMFARIVQERKVELVCEGNRFWDLRRWKMCGEVLNGKKVHGMFITKDANDPSKLTYQLVEAKNRPAYIFHDRFYLLPIPQSEIDKNVNLIQNPEY